MKIICNQKMLANKISIVQKAMNTTRNRLNKGKFDKDSFEVVPLIIETDKIDEEFDGYKLVPNWNGSGTLKIILDPGLPVQLNQAFTEIRGSVCQVDDDIFLTAPLEKFIDVYAVVNVDIDITVSVDGSGVYTIVLECGVANAKFVGKLQ